MKIPIQLNLDGEFPATCPGCDSAVMVTLITQHVGSDYGAQGLNRVNIQGTHTHTCPEPEGQP